DQDLGTGFRITDIRSLPNHTMQVSYPASANLYYTLYRATNPADMGTANLSQRALAVDLRVGTNGTGFLTDAAPPPGMTSVFYRVKVARLDQPGDTDQDGIDDVYELQHPAFLNPLDPADAGLDFDGDGLSNLYEYLHGANPADVPADAVSIAEGNSGFTN